MSSSQHRQPALVRQEVTMMALGVFRKAFVSICLAIAALLPLGCASPSSVSTADLQKRQQAMAKSDLLIVPGQRVGRIRLGMGWGEGIATLGDPHCSYTNPGDPSKIDTQMKSLSLNLVLYFGTSAAPTIKQISVAAQ